MTRVLISPAHYALAIDSKSEFSVSARIIYGIATINTDNEYFILCGKCYDKQIINLPNIYVIEIFGKDEKITLNLFKRILFYFKLLTKSISVLKKNKIDIIWHHFPSGWYSLNPCILFQIDKLFNINIKRVIGGLQSTNDAKEHKTPLDASISKNDSMPIACSRVNKSISGILKKVISVFSIYYFRLFNYYIFDTLSAHKHSAYRSG